MVTVYCGDDSRYSIAFREDSNRALTPARSAGMVVVVRVEAVAETPRRVAFRDRLRLGRLERRAPLRATRLAT